jgi:hypothetical protein
LACSQRSDPEESRETAENAVAASPSSTTPLVPPPARSYDLDADISLRTAFARFHVDASAPINVEGGIFVMVGDHPGRVYDDSVALAHQALAAYFNGRFSKRPEQAVTVYIFGAQKAYDAFCRVHDQRGAVGGDGAVSRARPSSGAANREAGLDELDASGGVAGDCAAAVCTFGVGAVSLWTE